MSFIKVSKYFLVLSALAIIASLALLVSPGPKFSIEFTGGTLMELSVPTEVSVDTLRTAFESFDTDPPLANLSIARTRNETALVRMRDLSNEEHLALVDHLKTAVPSVEELRFTTIGPTVGASLKKSSMWALFWTCVAIAIYVALAFRAVPKKLSPWRFGAITVITLFHDIIITLGVFIILSQFTTFEIDTLFITALLTTLGYSVNDTIVVFDRIRENVINQSRHEEFSVLAERSLRETLFRSLVTGGSTFIMLTALYVFGSSSIDWFILALIVGIVTGTYSSIFIATPLLVYWKKKSN